MGKLSKKIIIASSIVAIGAIGTMIVKKLYSEFFDQLNTDYQADWFVPECSGHINID